MSEVDLTDVKQEGSVTPFDHLVVENNEQVKETPAESSAEKEPAETAPSQGGAQPKDSSKVEETKVNTPDEEEKLPYHRSKRFKEERAEKEALRKKLEEMQGSYSKEIAELKSLIQSGQKTAKTSEVPPAFKKLFGEGQEELWKEWQTLFPSGQPVDANELKAQVLSEFKKEQAEQAQASKKQVEWVENELTKLKDDGLKFDKNELLSILEEYAPTDANGMLDFRKAYKLYELSNKAKPANQRKDVRKAIAASTSPQGVSEPVASDVIDMAKIRKANWRDIVKF